MQLIMMKVYPKHKYDISDCLRCFEYNDWYETFDKIYKDNHYKLNKNNWSYENLTNE